MIIITQEEPSEDRTNDIEIPNNKQEMSTMSVPLLYKIKLRKHALIEEEPDYKIATRILNFYESYDHPDDETHETTTIAKLLGLSTDDETPSTKT